MARFARNKSANVARPVPNTTNLAGGKAFKESPKVEIATQLLTSFVNDQFYRSADAGMQNVARLVALEPEFAAKAAVFARHEYGMRSISHVVAGEIAHADSAKGAAWRRRFFDAVVRRPDDITEILAYFMSKHGGTMPHAMKDGLRAAFGKFNAYALAKYKGEGSEMKLVDAVNLLHPKASERNADALDLLVKGELKSFDTWESELSAAGSDADEKAGAWKKLLKENKLGYFALLRNLRNILKTEDEDVVNMACEALVNEEAIKKSLVLPFRFYSASRELQKLAGANKVLRAVNKACDLALANVPQFPGKTLIALDSSGSMMGGVVGTGGRGGRGRSEDVGVSPAEIGSLFAAALCKANDGADLMLFSDSAKYLTLSTDSPVLTTMDAIKGKFYCGGTNFHAIFQTANKKYDRIIILSDMQGWMSSGYGYSDSGAPTTSFKAYKTRTGADPVVFSFDLQGYGTLQFPENKVMCLAGFSDKTLDMMKMLEGDRNALVSTIEAYVWPESVTTLARAQEAVAKPKRGRPRKTTLADVVDLLPRDKAAKPRKRAVQTATKRKATVKKTAKRGRA